MPTATNYGTAQNKTAATTVVLTTTAIIPAGTLLVIGVCADNVAAATPTISSITAVGGGTWTNRAGATTQSGATTTAGTGVFVYCQTLYAASQVASGTAITVTFNASPAAKAVALWGFDQMGQDVLRNTVVSAASTAGTPSAVTAGTALAAGDVVIGIVGSENNANPTGDADTLNGSWSAISGIATTGGSANTNTSIAMQYKTVTATGAQTFNPTAAADTVAIVFALVRANAAPTARAITGQVASPTAITLTWTPDSAAFPAPTVDISRSTDGSSFTPVATAQPDSGSYSATGLTTAQPYWFKIVSTNTQGSATSNTVGPLTPTTFSRANTFDGGTLSAVITTANSGGTSGDAFTATRPAAANPIFDNARVHSSGLAAKLTTVASQGSWLEWSCSGLTTVALRIYLNISAYSTTGGTTLIQLYHAGAGINDLNFAVDTGGHIAIAASTPTLGTSVLPLNQWVRIEAKWVSGSAPQVRYYSNADSTTITETITLARTVTDTVDAMRFFDIFDLAGGPFWLDDIAANELDWLGPVAGGAPPAQPPRNIHLSNAALQPAFNR